MLLTVLVGVVQRDVATAAVRATMSADHFMLSSMQASLVRVTVASTWKPWCQSTDVFAQVCNSAILICDDVVDRR
jgi:hypothetical protein